MLLADDLMVDDGALLRSMLDVHERHGRSCIAFVGGSPEEISSYGCIDPEAGATARARRRRHRDPARRREAAARRSAVEPRDHRSLRVHARDLHDARPHRAGTRRRAAAHRRDRDAARAPECVRRATAGAVATTSARSSTSCAPTSSSRSTAPISGPRSASGCASTSPRAGRRDAARSCDTRSGVIPLADAQATILDAVTPLAPRPFAVARRARARARGGRRRDASPCRRSPTPGMDGYAVRAADTPGTLRVVGELPAGRAPTIAVGPGEAIRIMTGAPMPDGADAVVMVERTRVDGDHVVVEVAQPTSTCGAAGGDVRGRRSRVRARHVAHARAPRRAREPRRARGVVSSAAARRRDLDRRRAGRARARSRRAASATPTGRCCSR